MRRPLLVQLLLHTWASPGTLIGVTVGVLGVCTGGGARRVRHTLEFHGGFVTWVLRNTPVEAMAMTLGHVIIGRSPAALDVTREHEWVHVRQYERWGPLFIPAYLGWSLGLWLARRDAYLENPFEREAFEHDRLLALGEVDRRSPYAVG
jgi:hypothetical protein